MWYPPQQQPQHNWNGYVPHVSSQQQAYSKSSYYYNGDETSTTYAVSINDENESSTHCQIIHANNNVHVTTPDCYVTSPTDSYTNEMSLYQTIPTRNPYWNPVIAAPAKMSVITNNTSIITPSVPVAAAASSSACWDWLLFPPEYYSEFYTPASTFVHHPQSDKQTSPNNDDDDDYNLLVSLPTCLLALLYLTPTIIRTSDDENDSDQEINSLPISPDEPLLLSSMNKKISSKLFVSSSSKNLNLDDQKSKPNRSSTPDTDDGYQSASDASRSDYSQQSSLNYDHRNPKDDIIILNEHSLPTPLMPRRISYAAAVKPTLTNNKISSLPTPIGQPKQMINNSLSNDNNGQKLKFIAPRFERMHHAKQYPSSSTTTTTTIKNSLSNRTQIRSTNNNNHQRNLIVNSTRRR